MIYWKLLWQVLFIVGLLIFIYMFLRLSYNGIYDLKKLLEDKSEERLEKNNFLLVNV